MRTLESRLRQGSSRIIMMSVLFARAACSYTNQSFRLVSRCSRLRLTSTQLITNKQSKLSPRSPKQTSTSRAALSWELRRNSASRVSKVLRRVLPNPAPMASHDYDALCCDRGTRFSAAPGARVALPASPSCTIAGTCLNGSGPCAARRP